MKVFFDKLEISRGYLYREYPYDLCLKGVNSVQVSRSLRAKAVKAYDRDNFETRITFTVRREHKTPAAAFSFVLSHPADVANAVGDIQFIAEEGDGCDSFVLKGSAVRSVSLSSEGCSKYQNYEVIGGLLCKKK